VDGSPRSSDEAMENQTSFDLSSAIQKWRENLAQSTTFRAADLDELEAHLRDAVPGLQAAGLSPEEAFLIATRRIGPREALESEFRKINATRAWLNKPSLVGLRFAMVFMILSLIGVGGAIEAAKRRAISDSVIQLSWHLFSGVFGALFVVMSILGLIGYVVLRAVSRPGSERLANIDTWPQERRLPRK